MKRGIKMIKINSIYTIIDKILTELKLTDKLIVTANTGFVHNQYFLFVDIENTKANPRTIESLKIAHVGSPESVKAKLTETFKAYI